MDCQPLFTQNLFIMPEDSTLRIFNILDFGARPDGQTLATTCIQAAVDAAAENGGGTVIVPSGRYLTGMIRLRSNLNFHLEAGSALLASTDPRDSLPASPSINSGDFWNHPEEGSWHLLYAENCQDLVISGSGRLDGQGPAHYTAPPKGQLGWPLSTHRDGRRPGALLQISNSSNIQVRDIRLGNVANWTFHLFNSRHIQVRDIRIENPADAPNADGIDISGCHFVTVSGCHIDTCDDAICLKTLPHSQTCENITVTNCVLRTHCVALKAGATESYQDMRNITFANCVVSGSSRAIGLYSLRGAVIENVAVSNVVCDTKAPLMFTRPIHLDLRRSQYPERPGAIRNIRISGLLAETNGRCLFTASGGARIENLILRDIILRYPVIDDPAIHGKTSGGTQFSTDSLWARTARSALVFDGVHGVSIEGLQIEWPSPQQSPSDPEWNPPAKLANGDQRTFLPADWQLAKDTPFAAIAWRNCSKQQYALAGLSGFQGGPTEEVSHSPG